MNTATKRSLTATRSSGSQTAQDHPSGPQKNHSGHIPRWLLGLVIALGITIIGLAIVISVSKLGSAASGDTQAAVPAAYDAKRAYQVLVQLCEIGPRPSGSEGMKRQQDYLKPIFERAGGQVTMQTFDIRHPENGSSVPMANMIASWNPDRTKRFLVCAHYDTRPYPDQDQRNRKGVFVGANDGASGTAALVELAHHLNDLPADVGVDLVLFDGEEFVWQQGRDEYFLGSKFFAEKYKANPPAVPYRAGVLLDMIGDRELKIYYERNSMRYAKEVAKGIWNTADRLGVRAFVPRIRHEIQDDHLPLNQTAGIPTVNVIDFDYPRPGIGAPSYWHTEQDVPANCSGQSLVTVVWVVHEWLKEQ